jgi:hypothetical protein
MVALAVGVDVAVALKDERLRLEDDFVTPG